MIVKGYNVAEEILSSGKKIYKAIVKESFKDPILKKIHDKGIKIETLKDEKFASLYQKGQGIALEIDDYQYESFEELSKKPTNKSFVLVLDSVVDPQNLGNMIRSFEALGGSFIVLPKNRSVQMNDTVMRISEGAAINTSICEVTNLNQALSVLKQRGYWIVGTDMDAPISYHELDANMPIALIIGSEGSGMRKLIREQSDFMVKIPMVGKINSLNASISAAIIMSDIIARRAEK